MNFNFIRIRSFCSSILIAIRSWFLIVIIFLFVHSFVSAEGFKFEENKGQWNSNVQYKCEFFGGSLFLEKNAFTYLFYDQDDLENLHHPNKDISATAQKSIKFHALQAKFLNANESTVLEPTDSYPYYKNYFIGNDAEKWSSNVKLYEKLFYQNMYEGIDINMYTQGQFLKYDFIVKPNASTNTIQIQYKGADKMYIDKGNLMVMTSLGYICEQKPYAYQIIGNQKKEIACEFQLNNNVLSFYFPSGYDGSQTLIIDPVLIVSTYTGSKADNWGYTATYDKDGNIYTGGIAADFGYPITTGAFQTTFAGGNNMSYPLDIVVSKFNSTGATLLSSTYIGGSDNESPHSLVVNDNGELYVLGETYSTNFPVKTGCFDVSHDAGSDIFIAKFNSSFTTLLASTFLGGSDNDGVNISSDFFYYQTTKYNYGDDARGEIILDKSSNVYVATSTSSKDFPVTNGAYQTNLAGDQDGLVFKMDQNLTSLTWATFIGGSNDDACFGILQDPSNKIYVTGGTTSSNFPTTSAAYKKSYAGGSTDGFIAELSSSGSALIASTFVGTSKYDQSFMIQSDYNNNIYVYGQTEGSYPVSSGVYSNSNGRQFIHELSSDLSTSIMSTVFGSGSSFPDISPTAFLVDTCTNIYCSGWGTCSLGSTYGTTTGLVTTSNAQQKTTDGCDFYFFVLSANATSLLYASFFGDPYADDHVDGGTSRFDKSGVIYQSVCASCGGSNAFPTTTGAWSKNNKSSNCNNAVIKMDFQFAGIIANASFTPGDSVCVGTNITFNNISTNAVDYLWDFGDGSASSTTANPQHTYNAPGTYPVKLVATNTNSCTYTDSTIFNLTILPEPDVDLGNDTVICDNETLTLNPISTGVTSYTWSTGESTSSISVSQAKTYWVKVSNDFCTASDSIMVNVIEKPELGNDTTVCEGTALTLNAHNTGASYLWSTGENTQTISVTNSGNIWVEVLGGICVEKDTVDIVMLPKPSVNLGGDTVMCKGTSIDLSAPISTAFSYVWNTGDTTAEIEINEPSTYSVTVYVANCESTDQITVSLKNLVNLGPDISLCEQPDAVIKATLNETNVTYLWNTGETNDSITVYEPGIYWVNVVHEQCTYTDSIDVIGHYKSENIYTPNTFTPINQDGLNDIFISKGIDITEFHLQVFDRWGRSVFITDTISKGWDGMANGKMVESGVYVWVVDYKTICTSDKNIHLVGRITVL